MRAISRLGLVSLLAAVGCSSEPPAPPRAALPAREDLGGLSLIVDGDDVVARLGDGPYARFALLSPSGEPTRLRATRLERDTGVFRIVLDGAPPLVITRGDPGSVVVAAPAGREVSLSLHGAFAFAPGSHLGDRRARDVSWALVEQGSRALAVGPARARVDATVVTASAPSLTLSWGEPASLASIVTRATVDARLAPPRAGHVAFFDDDGRAVGVGLAGADGVATSFSLGAPRRAVALLGGHATGAPIDVGDGPLVVPAPRHAHLDVRVTDLDTGERTPARVVVRGIEGTSDPTFGSPERASGAGPIFDADEGAVSTVLAPGRYRVFATRGVEFSADARELTLAEGGFTELALGLRRVVPTPGWISADLHVHSRGSFDSLVTFEDRVRSLVAAGVDFAAASEHNRVGTYASATFPAAKGLVWVPSVEVTTVNPLRGHFNVIPWEDPDVPRYQQTTLGRLVDEVKRRAPASLVQVNHPRLDGRIGYFFAMHVDPHTEKGRRQLPRGFHAIEVYNGFDLPHPARVDEVLRDFLALVEAGFRVAATGSSDSHTVQYVGAGYPRTYVRADDPIDGARVVDALKAGRAFATSGPIVSVTRGDGSIGDAVPVVDGKVKVRLAIKAAPWIALRSYEIHVGAEKVWERPLVREASFTAPRRALADEIAAAIALDEEIEVPVKPGARGLVVVVRGGPGMGEPLGVTDFAPLAIANPVYLSH